jgi:hypothetical protein
LHDFGWQHIVCSSDNDAKNKQNPDGHVVPQYG